MSNISISLPEVWATFSEETKVKLSHELAQIITFASITFPATGSLSCGKVLSLGPTIEDAKVFKSQVCVIVPSYGPTNFTLELYLLSR